MKDDFFKFPSTPHLATLAGVDIRGDKVLSESERAEFLKHDLVVEEKVDGANSESLLIRKEIFEHRTEVPTCIYLGSGQWKKLGDWLIPRTDTLFEHLSDHLILFGEWCYAQHSVYYDRLPDWFLGFDVYDKQFGRFLSSKRRDALFREMGVIPVPVLARGHFAYPEVRKFLSLSKLSYQPAEGIYLRFDQDDWLVQRVKLVRPAFIQVMEQHWSRSTIRPNRLRLEVQG